MRQAIVSSVVFGILIAATGCGASGKSARTVATATSNIADTSSAASWTPADEWNFEMTEETKKSRSTVGVGVGALPSPNRQAIARGQLHAAY